MKKQIKFTVITLILSLITASSANCMFATQANRFATQQGTRLVNTQKALELFKQNKRFKSDGKNDSDNDCNICRWCDNHPVKCGVAKGMILSAWIKITFMR